MHQLWKVWPQRTAECRFDSTQVPGRVGDASVPGAGAYGDSTVGGCGSTGDGDMHLRFLPCYQVRVVKPDVCVDKVSCILCGVLRVGTAASRLPKRQMLARGDYCTACFATRHILYKRRFGIAQPSICPEESICPQESAPPIPQGIGIHPVVHEVPIALQSPIYEDPVLEPCQHVLLNPLYWRLVQIS